MKIKTSKKIALFGIIIALTMILSYIEFLIPPLFITVPGIKMGLPNILIIYVLYTWDWKSAFLVSIIRVFLNTLLFGNIVVLLYSIAGAILSLTVMVIFKKLNLFSCVGVSVLGGIFHNLGQILVAMILLESAVIGYYMIILTITGTISGVFVGLLGANLIKKLNKKILIKEKDYEKKD